MKQKILYLVAIHTLVMASAFLIIIGYWLLYPYTPITVKPQPFPILNENKEVKRGETLVYFSETCRHFVGEVLVTRVLINHSLISFPEHKFFQDSKGCISAENRSLQIPTYAPTGVYHLEITSFIRVNPIRTVAVKISTEEFRVVE